jgi:AraC family transcriptional regulator
MQVQPRLLNLSGYINEHLDEELTLEILAARMNLSPFHFHRKFHGYFGESLHQHIKRLRLERSAYLLLYGAQAVSAVARQSGYKTLSAFSHAFSAHFGVAPTRYQAHIDATLRAQRPTELRQHLGSERVDHLVPARSISIAPTTMAFWRVAPGHDRVEAVCDTLRALRELGATNARAIIASNDLLGLATGSEVRIDVGVDAATVETSLLAGFGSQELPGGRFAVFEFFGAPREIKDFVEAIYLFWLPRCGERTRYGTHFVTVDEPDPKVFQIHIPLQASA